MSPRFQGNPDTDPRHVIADTSNDGVRQEFSVVFTARPTGGVPTPSDESREVRWIPADQIGALTMDRSMRMRIGHYLAGGDKPHLGERPAPSPVPAALAGAGRRN